MAEVKEGPVTDWLLALLRAMPGQFLVGDHRAPDGTDVRNKPYLAVYVVSAARSGPELAGSEDDLAVTLQVNAVGWTRQIAQALADKVHETVTRRLPDGGYWAAGTDPSGARVHDRISEGSPGGVDVSGTPPDEVYSVPRRYVVTATPTGS